MKAIIKVSGLITLVGAVFFALNAGSALAAPPPPFDPAHDLVQPHIPLDPGPELHLPSLCEMSDICDHLVPVDPCILTDTCGVNDSADDPTATPTDEPTVTPTHEPTATPTDEPTVTDEPTTAPTDVPPTQAPTVVPQPGNLPSAGSDGGIMNDVGGGVVALAGMSLGAMALAWALFFFARRREQTER
jgi:hypothetical protein